MYLHSEALQLKTLSTSPLSEDESHDKDRSFVCFFCGKVTVSLEGRNKLCNEDLTGRMVRACSSDGKLKERVVNKQSLASI